MSTRGKVKVDNYLLSQSNLMPGYSRRAALMSAPKDEMPDYEMLPETAYGLIKDELIMDGSSRINLATFCQTWMEPEARQLMIDTFDKNMIDKDEYPQTAEMEERCVRMLANLWHAPQPETTIGTSTIGSSEACMLGGMALKWRWREKMRRQGKPADKPNIVMGINVQVCWHKFARYWEIEERLVPVEGDRFILSPAEAAKLCDENTIGVVGIMGSTLDGQYEDIKGISDMLDDLQKRTGLDIPIHVDGASGAMVAPFLQPHLEWDFRLPRVKSINTSGHKYGLVFPGVGWVLWRAREDLPEDLIFNVNYLGGIMPTFAINFSRPGSQVVAQYYNFIRLGKDGYRRIHQSCQDVAKYLAGEIEKLGPFRLISDGSDIPVFAWSLKGPMNYSLYDLSDRLRIRGWQVPAYSMPEHRTDLVVQRIVVRHGFSHDMADFLLVDTRRALDYFAKQPGMTPGTGEGSGYHHT